MGSPAQGSQPPPTSAVSKRVSETLERADLGPPEAPAATEALAPEVISRLQHQPVPKQHLRRQRFERIR